MVLLLGLLLTGGLYAAFSPAQAGPDAGRRRARSRRAASSSWSAAPSATARTARASTPSDGNQIGPSLVGVGAAAVDFQVGTGRMPMAQPGAQVPRKKAVYTAEEIAALAAYVASLGPGPAIPTRATTASTG